MKKILSYVAYQRKLNIGVDLKNRGIQLSIFDFMNVENAIPMYTSYKNKGNNCYLCAICDYMNVAYNNGVAKYIPMARTSINTYFYEKISSFFKSNAKRHLQETEIFSLNDVINIGKNCLLTVSCNGGYHAIAFVNGKFYNNWNNRNGLTLDELKKDFGYIRTPKLIDVEYNVYIKLERCLEYGLIKKN